MKQLSPLIVPRRPRHFRGLTLLEVMIAMFIFLVGILGVLGAMPGGIDNASIVVQQDAAIHLAHSKFAEFRRDRIDPAVDLQPGSTYLPSGGAFTPGAQEPYNASGAPWRDFANGPGQTYENFDDIVRYEWRVDTAPVSAVNTGTPAPPAGFLFPSIAGGGAGAPLNLTRVSISVRARGSKREFEFTQYMCASDPAAK